LINALTAVGAGSNTVTHLSAPPPPYGTNLAALNGGNPNGDWYLFVQDDTPVDSGVISNGWILNLTMASPVGASADLALSMAASATNVMVGGTLVFTNTVINYGPSSSSYVVISDTLPLGFTASTTSTNIGTLTNGASAQFILTAQSPNSPGTNLVNSATASADTPDPNPADNFAFVSVNVTSAVGGIQPQLSAGVGSGQQFQLTVNGTAGQTYILQASTNLVNNWVNIYTGTPPFTFTDLKVSNYPARFYQVVPGP
jgi:uncharacterized repeat protein (TIGR01451 family)